MPALDEAIVKALGEHGPLVEPAITALMCTEPKFVVAALHRLRSARRLHQADGVTWARLDVPAAAVSVGETKPPEPPKAEETDMPRNLKKCGRCKQPKDHIYSNGYCRECSRVYSAERAARKKAAEADPKPAKPKIKVILDHMKAKRAMVRPLLFDVVLVDAITGQEHTIALGIETAKALAIQLAAL